MDYEFSNHWFDMTARSLWDQAIPQFKIKTALEIGSFEGASACYLLERIPGLSLTCIDTWEGSDEPGTRPHEMGGVEARFDRNTMRAVQDGQTIRKMRMRSDEALLGLNVEKAQFDFIYIDGSHTAQNCLTDSVLCWLLLAKGGLMIWDDYHWAPDFPDWRRPKPAINAFLACYETLYHPVFMGPQVAVMKP